MNKIKIGYFADGTWSHNAFELIIVESTIEVDFICVRFDTKESFIKLKEWTCDSKIIRGHRLK
tara:strand:+ start:978 stop:1166 length:189 start_codon:yes stop_codon:yes gene_type:complete